MQNNWYIKLRTLIKTDETAAQLFEQLQKAETDDEKELAKANAQNYIQTLQANETTTTEVDVEPEVPEVVGEPDNESDDLASEENTQGQPETVEETTEKSTLTDLSQPAFTPRLAKFGITREEELFLHGVFVRKMSREDKILMRRSIYNKKTVGAAKIQAEYKKKRIEQKIKDANDPEKIRYNQERKLVNTIVDALYNHCNQGWIFSNIEGLTPDIFRELISKPGIYNQINSANPEFIPNFKKRYGE